MTLLLKDGRSLSGIVRKRTERTLRLEAPGESHDIELDAIKRSVSSQASLMPDGFLDSLTEKQLADLMSYLMKK